MQRLHEVGGRRVLVTGTGPLGCAPAELAQRSRNGECAPDVQSAAAIFNPQLVQMIQGLNAQLGADVFIAADASALQMDFFSNPQKYGK